MEGLRIKDLINSVRDELRESAREREERNEPPLFYVDNLKLEVNFIVEQDKAVKGGFDLKLINVGGDITYKSQQVHKITLELKTPVSYNPDMIFNNTDQDDPVCNIETLKKISNKTYSPVKLPVDISPLVPPGVK